MKRGRGRRNHNRRARHIWRKTWLLSALAAAAILYGIVELRTGKEKTQDNAQVSAKMPPANPAAAKGLANDRDSGFGDSGEPEYLPQEWSIRVVDVNDTETVEIPAGWYQETDDASIRASLEQQAARIAAKWNRNPVDSQMEAFDKETGTYLYSDEVYGRVLDEGRLAEELFREVKAWKQEGGGQGRGQAGENGREETRPGPFIQASFLSVAPVRTKAQAKEQYKVIGTFSTTTTSNKNRNQNIRLAADAVDGLVLNPGEEFSFNMATGNRTSDKGYQPAGAYRNGVLIEEPGGGVCQVSTTLYHAIIQSGFKTTERNFHSFAPSYIEKGQDAMVSFDGYAGPDLRFVNTGSTSIGLRAAFADNKLKLSIVGLPVLEDGKTVSMRSEKVRDLEPPEPVYEENPELAYGEEKIVEQAQPGSVWKTYRQVKKDGELLEETALHTSTYKAKAAKIQRNSSAVPSGEVPGRENADQAAGLQEDGNRNGAGMPGGDQEAPSRDAVPQAGTGQDGPVPDTTGPETQGREIVIQNMPDMGIPDLNLAGPGNGG